MPAKRELSMRQLRHLLRLHHDGVRAREIGRRLGVARSTIQDNLKRAAAAGLAWPLADDITEEALETRLFGRVGVTQGQRRRVEPDWSALARELRRPGVTMSILWEEYREVHPEGYGYSRFCDLLRGFERRLTPVMRQHHVAGEKAFVDYSGKRIGIADPTTGEIREAEIFSAVLASRPHPEQGFRTCLGILRAYRGLDTGRLEAVSARAVELGVLNCKGVASLLARKFDPSGADSSPVALIDHANVRGPRYYN